LRIVATGVLLEEHPEGSARDGSVLVRATEFVEFDLGEGVQRWEETAQGPFSVSPDGSATSALLDIAENLPGDLLADLGIAGLKPSRFEYRSAPRRIDVDPGLAQRLILD
jgi:hypothetical protein